MKKKWKNDAFRPLSGIVAVILSSAICVAGFMPNVSAQRPFNSPLQNPLRNIGDSIRNIGKTVEADPNKNYTLTEMEGPFLILTSVFSGPNAQQDAHNLVLELRKSYKWNAYLYEKTFQFDAQKDFKHANNPYNGKATRYRNSGGQTEFAVLIGNFPSLDDRQFEKILADVRKCQPESLRGRGPTNPFAMAFGLANPMLPPEHQRGVVDAFIESINKDRPYSLLRNSRRYTVQIATYTGQIEFKSASSPLNKLPVINPKKKTALEMGEQAAAELCKTLRNRGIEAYEFHDRYASIVTVGSFDQPNHPAIQQIIQQYQARIVDGKPQIIVIDGIECDPVPVVIEVPRIRR